MSELGDDSLETDKKLTEILDKIDTLRKGLNKLQAQTLAITAVLVNLTETNQMTADRLSNAVTLIANSNNLNEEIVQNARDALEMIEKISQERRS